MEAFLYPEPPEIGRFIDWFVRADKRPPQQRLRLLLLPRFIPPTPLLRHLRSLRRSQLPSNNHDLAIFPLASLPLSMLSNTPIPIQFCWNGMVVFQSEPPFYRDPPLQFCGLPDTLAIHCCPTSTHRSISPNSHSFRTFPSQTRLRIIPHPYIRINPNPFDCTQIIIRMNKTTFRGLEIMHCE